MLEHLEWETLEIRRAKYQLTMMFKIIHGLVDIPADDQCITLISSGTSQLQLTTIKTASI